MESIKDRFSRFLGNARALIVDSHDHVTADPRRGDFDKPGGRREADRIVDDILDRAGEPSRIAQDHGGVPSWAGKGDLRIAFLAPGLPGGDQLLDQRAEIDGLEPRSRQLGTFLRVVFWNIERGLEYKAIEAAFTDPAKFSLLLDKKKYPRGSRQRATILQQVELMKQADVIVLNEADWGLKRTDYRNVVADLALAAKMNYAFGV